MVYHELNEKEAARAEAQAAREGQISHRLDPHHTPEPGGMDQGGGGSRPVTQRLGHSHPRRGHEEEVAAPLDSVGTSYYNRPRKDVPAQLAAAGDADNTCYGGIAMSTLSPSPTKSTADSLYASSPQIQALTWALDRICAGGARVAERRSAAVVARIGNRTVEDAIHDEVSDRCEIVRGDIDMPDDRPGYVPATIQADVMRLYVERLLIDLGDDLDGLCLPAKHTGRVTIEDMDLPYTATLNLSESSGRVAAYDIEEMF